MNHARLPYLDAEDIQNFAHQNDVEFCDKSEAGGWHRLVLWFIWTLFGVIGWFTDDGPDYDDYFQTLPCIFSDRVRIYLGGGLTPHDIIWHNFDDTQMSTLIHELTHAAQCKRMGWFCYCFRYLTRSGRATMEFQAEVNEIVFWKDTNHTVDYKYLSRVAEKICGPTYLWACSDEKSLTRALQAAKGRSRMVEYHGLTDINKDLINKFCGWNPHG